MRVTLRTGLTLLLWVLASSEILGAADSPEARHVGPVTDILRLDGCTFSVSQAGLLEGEGQRLSLRLQAPFRITSMAAVSADAAGVRRLLLAGGEPGVSGRVGLFTMTTGEWVSQRIAADLIYDVTVHPSKPLAALACADNRVLLIDLPSFAFSPTQVQHAHTGPVRTLSFAPNGVYLASGGLGGLVFISDYDRQGPPAALRDHTDKVECLAFSPDSQLLASGARDGKVRIHRVGGRLLRTYALGREGQQGPWGRPQQVLSIAWGERPERLVVGMSTGWLHELSLRNSDSMRLGHTRGQGPVFSLCFLPDGRLLVGRNEVIRFDGPSLGFGTARQASDF